MKEVSACVRESACPSTLSYLRQIEVRAVLEIGEQTVHDQHVDGSRQQESTRVLCRQGEGSSSSRVIEVIRVISKVIRVLECSSDTENARVCYKGTDGRTRALQRAGRQGWVGGKKAGRQRWVSGWVSGWVGVGGSA